MQTKNNYNVVWEKADGTVGTGMFIGDVGRIVEIDPSGELLVVNFDDRIATYTLDMLNEIDLAYAMTVHKAQGSEYQCVVLAAMPAAPSLMVRGVLYTALTRARPPGLLPVEDRVRPIGRGTGSYAAGWADAPPFPFWKDKRETGAVSLLDQPLREQTPRGRHPASPAYPPSRHG